MMLNFFIAVAILISIPLLACFAGFCGLVALGAMATVWENVTGAFKTSKSIKVSESKENLIGKATARKMAGAILLEKIEKPNDYRLH